jgi:hypothetical protein
VLHPALSQSSNKAVRQVVLFQVHGFPLPHITTGGFMLRLHLRKVPAEHEIGFLKKKLGSTQIRENHTVLTIVLSAPFAPTFKSQHFDLTKKAMIKQGDRNVSQTPCSFMVKFQQRASLKLTPFFDTLWIVRDRIHSREQTVFYSARV